MVKEQLRFLEPPNMNVAQKSLITITLATTDIKAEITKALEQGVNQNDLTKRLNKIIDNYCDGIEILELREETRRALVSSARKWYYQLSETKDILRRNLITRLPQIDFSAFTYLNNAEIGEIRKHLDISRKGLAVIDDYEKKLKTAIKALASEPPMVVKTKSGATYQVSLRNRAEMAVRYEANLNDLKDFINSGVEFVWTTSHPDASPRCTPHQGKLYSLNPDKKKGVKNKIPFTYLFDVLKLNDGNSIINGFNCRHRLVEYKSGSTPPVEYSREQIKREYGIDQKQRNYENTIRRLKTEEKLLRESGFLKEASTIRKRWRRLNKEYEIYSLENDRAFYRWRTIVSKQETAYSPEIEKMEEAIKYQFEINHKYTKKQAEEYLRALKISYQNLAVD